MCAQYKGDPLRTGGRPPMVAVNLSSILILSSRLYDYTALLLFGAVVVVRLNKRKCLLMDDVMTARKARRSGRRVYPLSNSGEGPRARAAFIIQIILKCSLSLFLLKRVFFFFYIGNFGWRGWSHRRPHTTRTRRERELKERLWSARHLSLHCQLMEMDPDLLKKKNNFWK